MRHSTLLLSLAAAALAVATLTACGEAADRSAKPIHDTEVQALGDAVITAEPAASLDLKEPDLAIEASTEHVAVEAVAAAAEPAQPVARYTLRRGETLAHFARWSELPVEDIAAASDLDLDGLYDVGITVKVPIEGEALAVLEQRREAHRQARVKGYLDSRGGTAGTEDVQVRSGQSAWIIAKDQSVPLWLLEAYNPTVDLDRLRPGQTLSLPVIADMVVASAPDDPEVDLLAEDEDSE